jgi:hypothetical protein
MARPDPRVEPESLPPSRTAETSVERVVVSTITAKENDVETAKEDAPPEESKPAARVTNVDPRIFALEPLVERNDWQGVANELGSLDDAGKLPPNLGIFAAIAHNELEKDGSSEARSIATRCMAGILGLPVESELVRVLSRRLLRKNAVRFRERPAPPARVSAFIILATIVIGGGVGWFLATGTFQRLIQMIAR